MTTPKIGVVGTGNMGRIHARILHGMRILAGVADTDIAKAKKIASEYSVKSFNGHRAMLDELKLDGIIIATPTPTHANISKDIAQNYDVQGLMIEKPFASSLKDAESLAKVLKKKKMCIVVGHSEIYNPVVQRAINLIREGAIGEHRTIIHDRRGFVQPSRIPSLGDVFEDIGVHDFDIMSRISSGKAKLYAQADSVDEIMNTGNVMVKFSNGVDHLFHLSRQYVGRRRSMDVSGTRGTLMLDLFGQIIKVYDMDQEPLSDERTIRLPERGATIKVYGEPLQQVISDFVDCIEKNTTPRVGVDDGVAALKVVEAARESARTGKVVDIEVSARE